MPNRIIKESICTSENIEQLTPFQETVFIRLIVNCDDFGRFFGNPKIVSARLFPLKTISAEEMEEALAALVSANLVVIYEVGGKTYIQVRTWSDHQQTRAKISKYPAPIVSEPETSDCTCNQLISDDSKCNQLISDDSKCCQMTANVPDIRYSIIDNRKSLSLFGDDNAADIQKEHDKVLEAAELAGFARNDATRAKLIDLYAVHGLQKMLDGINACVDHSVCNIAYLTAVLKGEPKKQKSDAKDVHGYGQRDYSGEQQKALERMMNDTWGDETEGVAEKA